MGRVAAQPVGQTGSAANGLSRRGEQSESIPPSPPYFKKSSYESTGFFLVHRMLHLPDAAQAPYPAYIATALHISVGLISEAPSGMAVIVG